MKSKVIYLIRHGMPESVDQQRRFIGQIDLELSETGHKQAQHQAKILKESGIQKVYTSDLKRAAATGLTLAATIGCPIETRLELREISLGEWEGQLFSDIAKRDPKGFKERGQDIGYFRPPNGESFIDLSQRVLPLFQEILSSEEDQVAIVSHAGVMRIILCHILGMPMSKMFKLNPEYGRMTVLTGTVDDLKLRAMNI